MQKMSVVFDYYAEQIHNLSVQMIFKIHTQTVGYCVSL